MELDRTGVDRIGPQVDRVSHPRDWVGRLGSDRSFRGIESVILDRIGLV